MTDAKRDSRAVTGQRWVVRITTGALAILAVYFAADFSIPQHTHLPSVALGQPLVYRIEVCLAVAYGGLLLLTPMIYGLLRGKLPDEISHRGAKWSKAADETIEQLGTSVGRLQEESADLRAKLVLQEVQLDGLAKGPGSH